MAGNDVNPPAGHWVRDTANATLALRNLLESHEHVVGVQARRLGMNTTDMQALRMLDVHGPLRPADLARRLNLRSASVTVLVDRLEAHGLVERIRVRGDRRRIDVHVLPDAAARLFEAWAPLVKAIDEVSRSLDPAAERAVCDFLHQVAAITDTAAAQVSADDDRS